MSDPWVSGVRTAISRYRSLVILGLCCELVYLGYFVGQFSLLAYYHHDTNMGIITGHSHAGFVLFVAPLTILFVAFALAWREGGRTPDEHALRLVLGFGALFALTLTFVYPITATDLYSYIAQSQVWVHYHHNPMFTPPAQFPRDPLMALSDGYQRYGSPYGPLGLVVDAIPSVLFGNRLLADLLALKLMFSAMALGSAYVAYLVMRAVRPSLAMGAALLIAWNPLVLLEVSANGHNDIAMLLLTLVALLAVTRNRLLLAPVLLALAAMIKYASALLWPLVLLYGLRRQRSLDDRLIYAASAVAWSFAVIVVLYFPFWQGPATLSNLLTQSQRHANSFSSVLSGVLPGAFSVDQAALVGWVLFLALYGYLLWSNSSDLPHLLQGCFLALFGFLALAAANVEGWYLLWPAVVAATVPYLQERAAGVLLSYGTELSAVVFGYIWVWVSFNPTDLTPLNAATYAMAFLPAVAALIGMAGIRPPGEEAKANVATPPARAVPVTKKPRFRDRAKVES